MKSKVVLAVIACLVVTADAQELWGGESERSRAEVYALEGLGALGGILCCSSCGGTALLVAVTIMGEGDDSDMARLEALPAFGVAFVAAAVLPAATAYGTIKAGDMLGEDGSKGWAFGGAYAGALVGAGITGLGFAASKSYAVRISSSVLGLLGVCRRTP